MPKIKLTSKRQATFPAKVCEDLGVAPGDELEIRAEKVKGKQVWVINPATPPRQQWIGSLKRYSSAAKGDHSMKAVRKSIAKNRGTKS